MAKVKKDIKKVEEKITAPTPEVKAVKEKNEDSSVNKFVLPVIKLAAVAGVVGGAVGVTAEFTKEKIAKNIYEQKLKSYLGMSKNLNNWTRAADEANDNFNIVSTDKMGSVTEYMVFCTTSIKEACVAGETPSPDVVAVGFTAEKKFEYGEMKMQLLLDKDGIIKGWSHIGFITSFGGETDKIKLGMDDMIGKPLTSDVFTNFGGASVPATRTALTGLLDEIKAAFDIVAAKSIEDIIVEGLQGAIDASLLTDTDIIGGSEHTALDTSVSHRFKFANGDYGFRVKFSGFYSPWLYIRIDNAGIIVDAYKMGNTDFATDNADCPGASCGLTETTTWFNALPTKDVTALTVPGNIAGGTFGDTKAGVVKFNTDILAAWNGRV